MDKRQDTTQGVFQTAARLIFSLIIILIMAACQGGPTPGSEVLPLPATPRATDTPAVLATGTVTPIAQKPSSTPELDCRQAGGKVQVGSFFSPQLGEDLHYQVYLPPCYHADIQTHYPVLYLLHGLSYREDQWPRLGVAEHMDRLIAAGTIPPLIIIMPGEARFLPPQTSAFAPALVSDLIPWVDEHYRTRAERDYRAIGGLSRGAAWAVHLGFENHQLFSRVGAHSLPLFEIDGGRLNAWLAQIPVEELPSFFIDIGRSDPERLTAQNFADQLNAHSIPHTWYLFNGGHTETYWSSHLELYLHWYANDWSDK